MKLEYLVKLAKGKALNAYYFHQLSWFGTLTGYWYGLKNPVVGQFSLEGSSKVLSVYYKSGDYMASTGEDLQVTVPQATKLGKKPFTSYPAINDLFQMRDKHIRDWLRACSWQSDWPYNDNFVDKVARDYVAWYQGQTPLYSKFKQIYAIEGGYPVYINTEDQKHSQGIFCLKIVKESEPFLNIYEKSQNKYWVQQELT